MGCGGSQEIGNYVPNSIIIQDAQQGYSEIRRHPSSIQSLNLTFQNNVHTLKDVWINSVNCYGSLPFLGTQKEGLYQFLSYNEVDQLALSLGYNMIKLNLVPILKEYKDYQLGLVGVFSKNRAEWIILDIANILFGFTMVPFYDTLGAESIPFILLQTNLTTLFISSGPLKTLLSIPKDQLGKLKNIILLDEIVEADEAKLKQYQLNYYHWAQLLQPCQQKQTNLVMPNDIYTISYTSGTTGNPKGALITHSNFLSAISNLPKNQIFLTKNDVYLSYLPLPHVMERLAYLTVMSTGGQYGFYRGDTLLLKEDIARLKPTWFASVPRLYNKFYDGIMAKINALDGIKKDFIDKAIQVKLENLKKNAEYTHIIYDQAFKQIRELFGGRMKFMITGSAPINREVLDFLKIAVCCPIYEGYGQTESTGSSFVTFRSNPNSGHVGGPTANTEAKLVDVPEMGYTTTSTDVVDNKSPCPRGEIWMRGHGIIPGYYKDEERTKETIDQEGWLKTGDIGMFQLDGTLKIIDRKKNIFKLSQGEYIAPEKIESVYLRANGVAEVFVHGDSLQSCCVAVVVPDKEYVFKWSQQEKISEQDFEKLCKEPKLNQHILNNLITEGKQNKLNSLEQVKSIYLFHETFAQINCTTSTFKLQRHQAKVYFQEQLDQLYTDLNKLAQQNTGKDIVQRQI